MRLHEFTVANFRILQDLTLDFRRTSPLDSDQLGDLQRAYRLDFLAGVNGTGKSTALHLLGRLFAALDNRLALPFIAPVTLTYSLDVKGEEHTVAISTLPPRDVANPTDADLVLRHTVTSALRGEVASGIGTPIDTNYLPERIVLYTSGDEPGWLASINEASGQAERAAASEVTLQERIIYLQTHRLPAVVLCGLLASRRRVREDDPTKEILRDVLDSLHINALVGFSIRCRIHQGLIQPSQFEAIDQLRAAADRITRHGADDLLFFDLTKDRPLSPNGADRHHIHRLYENELQLFQQLSLLYEHAPFADAPLQEISLFLTRSRSEGEVQPLLHLYEWLSDGEHSFLARMALFALFRTPNVLILLDEPEVHFNDVWKREIVNTLHQIMAGQRSHALITTHSSITITDVPKEHILLMRRDGAHTHESAGLSPTVQTFGADPSDVIVHVFGSPHASGARSVRFIRDRIQAAPTITDLENLRAGIAPGYWRYRVQLEIAQRRSAAR